MPDEKVMQKVDSVVNSIRIGLMELQKLALRGEGSGEQWAEIEQKLREIDHEIWDDLVEWAQGEEGRV